MPPTRVSSVVLRYTDACVLAVRPVCVCVRRGSTAGAVNLARRFAPRCTAAGRWLAHPHTSDRPFNDLILVRLINSLVGLRAVPAIERSSPPIAAVPPGQMVKCQRGTRVSASNAVMQRWCSSGRRLGAFPFPAPRGVLPGQGGGGKGERAARACQSSSFCSAPRLLASRCCCGCAAASCSWPTRQSSTWAPQRQSGRLRPRPPRGGGRRRHANLPSLKRLDLFSSRSCHPCAGAPPRRRPPRRRWPVLHKCSPTAASPASAAACRGAIHAVGVLEDVPVAKELSSYLDTSWSFPSMVISLLRCTSLLSLCRR